MRGAFRSRRGFAARARGGVGVLARRGFESRVQLPWRGRSPSKLSIVRLDLILGRVFVLEMLVGVLGLERTSDVDWRASTRFEENWTGELLREADD